MLPRKAEEDLLVVIALTFLIGTLMVFAFGRTVGAAFGVIFCGGAFIARMTRLLTAEEEPAAEAQSINPKTNPHSNPEHKPQPPSNPGGNGSQAAQAPRPQKKRKSRLIWLQRWSRNARGRVEIPAAQEADYIVKILGSLEDEKRVAALGILWPHIGPMSYEEKLTILRGFGDKHRVRALDIMLKEKKH